jgi:hypothetical protein
MHVGPVANVQEVCVCFNHVSSDAFTAVVPQRLPKMLENQRHQANSQRLYHG